MSVGDITAAIVLGVVGNIIAAFLLDAYKKKCEKRAFEAESIALDLLNLAVSILPEEDRAKLYDQWLADLVYLDTSLRRMEFASGLPLAALKLRSKALLARAFATAMKVARSVSNTSGDRSTVTQNPSARLRQAKRAFFSASAGMMLILGAYLMTYVIFNLFPPEQLFDALVSPSQLSGFALLMVRVLNDAVIFSCALGAIVFAYSGWLYVTAAATARAATARR